MKIAKMFRDNVYSLTCHGHASLAGLMAGTVKLGELIGIGLNILPATAFDPLQSAFQIAGAGIVGWSLGHNLYHYQKDHEPDTLKHKHNVWKTQQTVGLDHVLPTVTLALFLSTANYIMPPLEVQQNQPPLFADTAVRRQSELLPPILA